MSTYARRGYAFLPRAHDFDATILLADIPAAPYRFILSRLKTPEIQSLFARRDLRRGHLYVAALRAMAQGMIHQY